MKLFIELLHPRGLTSPTPRLQVEDPAMRWQMSLYKEMAGKAEDADDPEKVVKRVQEVSAVLYHIEVVSGTKR